VPQAERQPITEAGPVNSGGKSLCTLGGTTALLAIAIAPAEIVIGLFPSVAQATTRTITVIDWFTLFQTHWFVGLRNLGFLNIVAAALLAPTILAVYFALKRDNEAYAALGAVLFFVGIAVYLAGSRAFPMLSLSHQYANAATDAQRSLLAAAGQAMLAEGESRAGVLLIEFACVVVSAVMLKGRTFSKATACTGMLGNGLLMAVEIVFVPVSSGLGVMVAASAGLLLVIWYALVGRRLLQLGCL